MEQYHVKPFENNMFKTIVSNNNNNKNKKNNWKDIFTSII